MQVVDYTKNDCVHTYFLCYNFRMTKFIIGFILLLILVVGGYIGFITVIKDLRGSRAETMSAKYITNLFSEYHIIGKNCQGEDTNGDSYVSCDIRIQKGEDVATEKVINLSCPTMWKSYTGSTCKERISIPSAN